MKTLNNKLFLPDNSPSENKNKKMESRNTGVQINKGKKICGRKCEVYSRVCGYFRPVANWNKGKKEEFKDRKKYITDINGKENVA